MDCIKLEENNSLVRVLHASPHDLKIDIYFNDKKIYNDIYFKEISKYIKTKPGSYRIDVYESGKKERALIKESVTIDDKEIYTIAIVGNMENLSLLVINDYFSKTVSEDYSSFRAINLSINSQPIDIFVDDDLLFKNIGYKQGTIYADVNINEYNVGLSPCDENKKVFQGKIKFKANRIYTLYIVGKDNKIAIIQSVDGNTYLCH